ncbi:hypothetical protein ACT3TS_17025 [Specibacter sp. AOP5-B1-6]|uniref:hypothetical protein n=1 Tax=Specibacter sp. AOP5-B1-6 TaxID=3457653 RepID=UPI00402B28F8
MRKSVAKYAQETGISERRVRQLAESGQISAAKLGNVWVIEEPVFTHAQRRAAGGRPLSEESTWELALMLDGYAAKSHRPSRARERIESLRRDPQLRRELNAWMVNRAHVGHFRVQPRDLPDLRGDERLLVTGVSHPASGLLQAQEHEAYVLLSDLPKVVEDYMLIPSSTGRSNALLRAINAHSLPRAAPRLMIAADLLDRGGPREISAAQKILDEAL